MSRAVHILSHSSSSGDKGPDPDQMLFALETGRHGRAPGRNYIRDSFIFNAPARQPVINFGFLKSLDLNW